MGFREEGGREGRGEKEGYSRLHGIVCVCTVAQCRGELETCTFHALDGKT